MKEKRINIRVSEEEYDTLKRKVKEAGIRGDNLSEYVRRQILGEEYPYVKEKLLRSMHYQIQKIGVNINQITKRNNSGLYFAEDKEELKQDMQELRQLFLRLQRQIKGTDQEDT